MPLPEYVNFYIRRETVEGIVAWLDGIGGTVGVADECLEQLRAGLDRDRHRIAFARIDEIIGPLPPGDVVEAIVLRLRELRSGGQLRCDAPDDADGDTGSE